jgi:sensor c-di-GMP phosphodiesterase-like protein
MCVVAEGIETQAVRDCLAGYGCDQGQGFLLSRPVPVEQLTHLAQGHTELRARRNAEVVAARGRPRAARTARK